MTCASLQELNFDKYLQLLCSLAGCQCPLIVFDSNDELVWTSAHLHPESYDLFKRSLETEQPQQQSNFPENILEIQENHRIAIQNLDFQEIGRVGYLVTLIDGGESKKVKKINKILGDIAGWIKDDYLLVRELNDMADELTARYEELNLMYSVEDKINNYSPEQGRDVLIDLIEDFWRYLDIDSVALILLEKELEIKGVKSRLAEEFPDPSQLFSSLSHGVYALLHDSKKSIVLNKTTDPYWQDIYPNELSLKLLAAPVLDNKAEVCGGIIALNRDCKTDFTNSDRKLLEVLADQAAAAIQANYDNLTGLLNRRSFEHFLENSLLSARDKKVTSALLYLDLDQFKIVNDTAGYDAGDELLKQVAHLLRNAVSKSDYLARLSGDEFAILLQNCSLKDAAKVANDLLTLIKDFRFSWEEKLFDIKTSIGCAAITSDLVSNTDLLTKVDTACHIAKQQGRNRIHVYQDGDATYAKHHKQTQWIHRINHALEEDRFCLYLQPIVPIEGSDKSELHYEVLLRLLDEDGQAVPPFAFIPAAERFQIMPRIDRWVVQNTFSVLNELVSQVHDKSILLSINLSGQTLSEDDFLYFIINELEHENILSESVCFEITETAVISNLDSAINLMSILKRKGCQFSLDDFGSGLSSFSYLKNLPVDYLKIDGFFVKEVVHDPINRAMVESISHIGRVMGIKTIAEFVEDDAILRALATIGIDYAQGYGIGRPRPLNEELDRLLGSKRYTFAEQR